MIIMSERPVRGPVAALPLKKVASLRAAEKQAAKQALETVIDGGVRAISS
jgi:hypothetical protein